MADIGTMDKRLIPALIAFLLGMLVLALWASLEQRESALIQQRLDDEAERILDLVEVDVNTRIKSLRRLVFRWQARGGTPQQEFESDALAYVADDPGYQAIEWVDSTFHIRWIAPLEGNEQAVGLDLAFEDNRRKALYKARDSQSATMSNTIDLVQGGKGVLIYLPISINGRFDGFILAVFKVQQWLEHVLQVGETVQEKANFRISILFDEERVYKQQGWDDVSDFKRVSSASSVLSDHWFEIQVRPTALFLEQSHTLLPELVLFGGMVLAILVGVIISLFQTASHAAQAALSGKVALESEIRVRKQVESLLAEEKLRLSCILEGTNVGTWEWNIQTNEASFNERWAEIIGYTLNELTPISIDTWRSRAHPDDLQRSSALLEKHFAGELDYYEAEVRMKHKEGHWIWVLDRGKVSSWSEDGKPLLMAGTHQEITQRKLAEEKIHHLATHDALTDLPSIRLAQDRLEMAINSTHRSGKKAAVLFIDLDGFKLVNDTLGHDAGNDVLKEVAYRLTHSVRDCDTVARVGGDEFLIILTEMHSQADAGHIAEKVVKTVAKPFEYNGNPVKLGVSIGVAMYPDDGFDGAELISRADNAMYLAKQGGKGSYKFSRA